MRQDWDKRKIDEICEVLNGFAFKSSEYVENGIRVIRITNVQKGFVVDDDPKYYPMTAKESIKSYLLNSGDLLMSLTGNVGRVGVLQKEMLPAALNQRVACLRIKDKRVLLKYLFHNLNSPIFEQDCINSASGVAQKNMSTEWLKKYLIGIPPIAEQEKIVAELDCLTGIIEKKKQQLEELDKLAQSIFYDMFGDPITNEKGWKVQSFGEVFRLKSGDGLKEKDFAGGVFPVYGGNGISGYHDTFNKSGKHIVIGRVGAYCGNVRFVQGNFWLTDNAFDTFFDGKNLDYSFICYMLNALDLHQYANHAAQPVISNAGLREVLVMLPPLPVQNDFARKIEALDREKGLVKRSIVETETLFNSRMDYWFN